MNVIDGICWRLYLSMEGNVSWIARSTIRNITKKDHKDCEISLGCWGTNTMRQLWERNGHVCLQCFVPLHNFLRVFGSFCIVLCGGDFFLWLCWTLLFLCHHLTSVTWEFYPDLYLQCVITECPKPSRLADFWLATHCAYMFCCQKFDRIW